MKIEVREAKNQREIEIAFKLASQSFGNGELNVDEMEAKKVIWFSDPSFSLDNIILAFNSDQIVGVVRIVPKILCRMQIQYTVAGFSSICIDKQFRGKKISVPLIQEAIAIAERRKFDLALLVARKAVDHYYVQFGFHGISSYEKISIEAKKISLIDEKITFTPIENNLIPLYSNRYYENYFECFGRFLRTYSQWKFILHLISLRRNMEALTILYDDEPIGYCFIQNGKVCELAVLPKFSLATILANLKQSNKIDQIDDWFDLPSNHLLIRNSNGFEIRVQRRECSYGGHMARILQIEKFVRNYEERTGKSFKVSQKTNLNIDHKRLNQLLGCWAVSTAESEDNGLIPFNLSYMDQF
ncbi:GNAT family N-acetyltransferase [Leptospira kirschneri]|uniref:GNAT family N-acetyltransferase n=1 Tax=Leptospira kirschneri TaxID=29507 RepID=UPI00356812E1